MNLLTSLFLSLSLMGGLFLSAQPITDAFSLKWSTSVGVTTFRTQMQWDARKRQVIIGSNGQGRDFTADSQDGVYVLKGKTGQVRRLLQPADYEDGDVNGVALYKKWTFFGNDDATVYGYKGKRVQWSFSLPSKTYDFEGQPALGDLNGDGFPDLVIAAEDYGLLALNGKTGDPLWQFAGVEGNGHGLNSPALHDLNGDGTPDVLWGTRTDEIHYSPENEWGTYGDYAFALDGRDGNTLWKYPLGSAVHASPMIREEDGETVIYFAATYSTLLAFNPAGTLLFTTYQGLPTIGISAYFSSPAISKSGTLFIGTSWWGEEDGIWVMDMQQAVPDPEKEHKGLPSEAKTFYQAGLVSATARMGDLLPHPGEEAFLATESGELFVFSEQGELLHRLELPAGVEAPALIADVDRDGKRELLIACLDGTLYCYEATGR